MSINMSVRYVVIAAVLIVLTLVAGCGGAEPMATPLPPSATSVPPTATPLPPTSTPRPSVKAFTPEMVLVEAGSFEMGSSGGVAGEQPVHTVRIIRSFYISKYEVTWEQYDQFGADTGRSKPKEGKKWGIRDEPRYPACVTWYDATAFCNWLSEREGLTPCYSGRGKATQCNFDANGYRLPTEAEWEYAARGGQQSQRYTYAGGDNVDDVAWYGSNSGGQTHPVGQKQPNELGLYDMSGNAWEWCWDWYGEEYYSSSPTGDPKGPSSGSDRVRRSGSWIENPDPLRTTYRSADVPSMPFGGIRLVRIK